MSLGSLLVIVLLRTVATSFGTLQREQAQGGQAGSAGHRWAGRLGSLEAWELGSLGVWRLGVWSYESF